MRSGRRNALLLIAAGKGYKREARGLIGRSIKQALGVKRWGVKPHYVSFISERELADGGSVEGVSSRFEAYVTDAELAQVLRVLKAMAEEETWTTVPVEVYHD